MEEFDNFDDVDLMKPPELSDDLNPLELEVPEVGDAPEANVSEPEEIPVLDIPPPEQSEIPDNLVDYSPEQSELPGETGDADIEEATVDTDLPPNQFEQSDVEDLDDTEDLEESSAEELPDVDVEQVESDDTLPSLEPEESEMASSLTEPEFTTLSVQPLPNMEFGESPNRPIPGTGYKTAGTYFGY